MQMRKGWGVPVWSGCPLLLAVALGPLPAALQEVKVMFTEEQPGESTALCQRLEDCVSAVASGVRIHSADSYNKCRRGWAVVAIVKGSWKGKPKQQQGN